MKTYVLERTQTIDRSLDDTFAFFSDAYNLEKLTPKFLRFKILTPQPIKMIAGALIDYSLSLFGIPFNWQTLIEKWEPGKTFVDRQIKGPYALWVHTHTFEAIGAEKTLMKDRVEYQIPMGVLGEIAHGIFVKRTLEKIFDYRAKTTAHLLAPMSQSLSMSNANNSRTKFATDIGD